MAGRKATGRENRRKLAVSMFAHMGRAAQAQAALDMHAAQRAKGIIDPSFDKPAAERAYEEHTTEALECLDRLVETRSRGRKHGGQE